MKTQVTWTFGNFSITAEAEIPLTDPVSPLTQAIVNKGFLQLLQRVPASNAEKVLAGYDKRPAGFKRDSILYSEDNALKLIEAFGMSVEVEEGVNLPFAITNVTEHEGSEAGVSRKMATEMWAKVAGTPMEAALGLTGDDITDEQGIEACHKFLSTLRAKPVKKG